MLDDRIPTGTLLVDDDDRIARPIPVVDTSVAAPGWAVSALFTPPVRLGWRYRAPNPREESPDLLNPPQSQYDAQLARGRRLFNVGVGSVVVAAIFLLLLFGSGDGAGRVFLLILYAVGLYQLGRWAFEIPPREARAIMAIFVIAVLFASFLLQSFPPLQIPLDLLILFGLPAMVVLHGMNVTSTAEAMRGEHDAQIAAWRREIEAFNRAEEQRWQRELATQWMPVQLRPSARVLTVFGGSALGWSSLLATLGTSVLAEGGRMTVLDLSERAITDELATLARQRGLSVRTTVVPDELDQESLLGGIAPDALAHLLVEVLHARDDKVVLKENARDLRILSAVCTNLSRPVTVPRIQEGLRALRLQRAPASARTLSNDEYEVISKTFGDEERDELRGRIIDIDHQLTLFSNLAAPGDREDHETTEYNLHVFTMPRRNEILENEYLVDLLFQLLLRQFRHDEPDRDGSDVFVIVGADRVSSRGLNALTDAAEREAVRLVYLFKRLTKEGQDVLGLGGGYAAFMKLGNHEDARIASEYIGKDFKFVMNQVTRGTGTSTTETTGTSITESDTRGTSAPPGLLGAFRRTRQDSHTRSWTDSRSLAEGTSENESTSEGRVQEAIVEPHQLQQLPETGLFYVEMTDNRRIVRSFIDCSPEVVGRPGVSQQPLEL